MGCGESWRRGGWDCTLRVPAWSVLSPDSGSQVRRRSRCLRDAARHPDTVVALCLDEFGSQRWPEVAPTWGLEAAVAPRAGNPQQGRTIGALNALTGQVNYLDGYLVGRQPGASSLPSSIVPTPRRGSRGRGSKLTGTFIPQPDGLTAVAGSPRITPVWLPTSAPWLNPIEKLWRWLRHDVLKLQRWVEDWPQVKHRVHDFLDPFVHGSAALLRSVGLKGKGKLATMINTS